MRAILLRPKGLTLAAALILGTTAGGPARAQETPFPAPPPAFGPKLGGLATPDALVALIGARLGRPALPPSEVRVFEDDGIVGSVPAGAAQAPARRAASAVPPALSFEDAAPVRSAALLTGNPGADRPAPEPTIRGTDPVAPPALGVAAPPAPPAEPATAAAPPSPVQPAAVASQPPLPPAAAALASLLTAFPGETVPGDTTVQATERRKSREAIAGFYAARSDAPLWTADGRFSAAARSALARIDHAAEDGLDLRRTTVPVPRGTDPAALAAADLALSEAVVAYGRQATGSRVDVAHLGGLIDFRPDVAPADRILRTVSTAADAGDALHAFNPQQPGYQALRDKLAELRQANPPEAQSRIPAGPVLRPGMKDARVPLIRARFGLDVASIEPGVPERVYDTEVAAAVAGFQRAHGLPASGLLTPRTVAVLSGGNPTALESTIIANMELWRWLPRELAPDRVEVNIPDYTARVLRDGASVHQTRVVVGQPDKPTPVSAEQMRLIIVPPYWNAPLSIIKNEMTPKLAADPGYFANHGYEVVERNGTTYVRQPPGDGNALGRIKFMFPNSHSVYLHDTNARSYFGRDMRALSHGCVRVEQPFSFAEAVLGRENGWSEARVKKLIGGQERTINLPKPLPILITYFTAFVDPQTGFQLRDDVYGYAGRVKAALNLPS